MENCFIAFILKKAILTSSPLCLTNNKPTCKTPRGGLPVTILTRKGRSQNTWTIWFNTLMSQMRSDLLWILQVPVYILRDSQDGKTIPAFPRPCSQAPFHISTYQGGKQKVPKPSCKLFRLTWGAQDGAGIFKAGCVVKARTGSWEGHHSGVREL